MSENFKLQSVAEPKNRNTVLRIAGAINHAEKVLENLRTMDAGDAKDLLHVVREESKVMTSQSQLLALLAGGEIPDKAMKAIEEAQPIKYVEARAMGGIPVSRADDTGKIDDKGNRIFKIVWFMPQAVKAKKELGAKGLLNVKDGEFSSNKEGTEKVLNELDLQRGKINFHKTAITQYVKAAKIIKQEELKALHDAKKTASINIYALGQAMLKDTPHIQVEKPLTA